MARDGLPMDSGTGPHDGYRYRRALEGVKAHTIRPSLSGLYAGVGATADVARRFLAAMAAAGEIVRNAENTAWITAQKPTAKKAAKKWIKCGISKQNYGQPMPEKWLRRIEGGILTPGHLGQNSTLTKKKEKKANREEA